MKRGAYDAVLGSKGTACLTFRTLQRNAISLFETRVLVLMRLGQIDDEVRALCLHRLPRSERGQLTRSDRQISLGLSFIGWRPFQSDGHGFVARTRSGLTNSQAAAPSTDKPAATKKEVVQPNRAAIAGVSEAVRAPPN